jgi:hypothetical protein
VKSLRLGRENASEEAMRVEQLDIGKMLGWIGLLLSTLFIVSIVMK